MKLKYWFVLMIVLGACTDKYVVKTNAPSAGYLVVEGFINISGSTVIYLTRSSGVDTPIRVPEAGAKLEIESQFGGSIPLLPGTNGSYSVENLVLDPSQQYRLHIQTVNGKEYLSEFSQAIITPPVDDVGWTANSDEVIVNVSTHDPLNPTGYYQWQFEETWRYHSAFSSSLEYVDSNIVPRPPQDLNYYCYRSDSSTQIAIASTEKLSANVVYQFPINEISYSTTNKLLIRYSILVKQYSLSKDWYQWVQKIKKNTESRGSIFDAQPGETGGNIKCVSDPLETVIGFVGCATETQKRIFIDRSELPSVIVSSGYDKCSEETIPNMDNPLLIYFGDGSNIPTVPVIPSGSLVPTAIKGSSIGCVDCRVAGGTTAAPPFWQ